ncbi:DUF2971 domain-containing protein [Burkholderia ubonensis]|uniref:DUF2971 domain-containing protein n=1 Tax=Burkholderia ubonensis TaxID=101571 RepID=UPI000F575E63|nr:DUF2971 domain-containing protein [Burkholderia ubonensis]RQP36507.1 DUF2971 domain-containing protein [Burkholderia ubonensis]RQP46662.1 DUF2971 domain-containing protein [Burkholderia ubonensis]RQP47618.1 DUF2971 domain-containing protein [Burkholderia ubonensis]RQP61653.1 DUF2971 domain-containing protein [Burkholderia ubonensis]RQP61891.1 DUF2971 domain-containing protein [Burkholderia ubonensis]
MSVPNTVYHYCGAEAFLSILKGGSLWVSDARKTNDRQELEWFKSLAFRYLEAQSKGNADLKAVLDKLDFHFEVIQGISDYFVCCFSEERDSVPQWAAYAERGAGFAVGFDANALRMAVGAPLFDSTYSVHAGEQGSEEWGFAPVFYGEPTAESDQIKHLRMLIDIEPLFSDKDASLVAWEYIDRVCAFCKHPDFRTEREWRIVHNATLSQQDGRGRENPAEKRWRHGPYGLTPYFETPDVRGCIREIVIGPANVDRNVPEYVGQFLQSVAVNAKIDVSKSPYR